MAAQKKPPAPRKPRLPRFSPTRLELYRFCPRAYGFQYDQGLRWGFTSPIQSFGASLHRTLQVFHAEGGAEAMTAVELKQRLAETWSGAGYESEEQAKQFLEEAERLLERHHASSLEPGRQTIATEITVQHGYGDLVLFGKIDRLDRRPDGSLEVIDYKSGRRAVTEEQVRSSLAMAVYQLLVARQNPGVPVYTTILALRTGERASVLRSAEDLDAFEAEVVALARTILADAEKPACPGEQCRDCPYPRLCPPGRAWLRSSDSAPQPLAPLEVAAARAARLAVTEAPARGLAGDERGARGRRRSPPSPPRPSLGERPGQRPHRPLVLDRPAGRRRAVGA